MSHNQYEVTLLSTLLVTLIYQTLILGKVSVSDRYRRYSPPFYLVSDRIGNQWYRTSLTKDCG